MPKKKQNAPEITPAMLKKLKELRKNVGLRKFVLSSDRSYTQWKNETENLVIRIFGQPSNQYDQFNEIVSWYEDNQPEEPEQSENAAYDRVIEMGYSSEEEIEEMSDKDWDKLLKEKGVLKELEKEEKQAEKEYEESTCFHTSSFKDKMRDAFTAWIKELELFVPISEIPTGRGQSVKTIIKNVQDQKVNVSLTVNIDQVINTIIKQVKAEEPDEEKVKEAESKLGEFKEEIKKENPQWSKIKKFLEWALNFGRDVFIKILPILLEKYK